MKPIYYIVPCTSLVITFLAVSFLFIDFPYSAPPVSGMEEMNSNVIKETSPQGIRTTKFPAFKNIMSEGSWFVDPTGRVMLLRGVNLGRSSMIPLSSSSRKANDETDSVITFTGRPFPLKDADIHFKRLKAWGFRFLRYVVSWEAIEHAGPGRYDQEYLNYTAAVLKKAGEYGFNVFIDPHEDVWSRATGGDGAPAWTVDRVGFNTLNLWETGAAISQNHFSGQLPPMTWPTNFNKLGAGTMFTLFFAGDAFAPHLFIEGISAQTYLQSHYINAMLQLVRKLKGYKNVIGFDTMNEPQKGWIGVEDLSKEMFFSVGPTPTPFTSMRLGAGEALHIPSYTIGLRGTHFEKDVFQNARHTSAWKSPARDLWKNEGIWTYDRLGRAVLLKPGYFNSYKGRAVDFTNDFMKPFMERFARAITHEDPSLMIFVENLAMLARLPALKHDSIHYVNSPHVYDVLTLTTKNYFSWIDYDALESRWVLGKYRIRKLFNNVLHQLKTDTQAKLGAAPTIIGEVGIPIDLARGKAYASGDFSDQEEAYDRCIYAMEHELLSYTLWNYSPENRNQCGDNWEGEDLSIFSISQQTHPSDINSGGRALHALIRPYPYKISGMPVESSFNYKNREFFLSFRNNPTIQAPTEIFIPAYQYPHGYKVWYKGGHFLKDSANSLLLYYPGPSASLNTLVIKGN